MAKPDKNELPPHLADYRETLVKLEQEAHVDYDKAVMTLSGGALGISFAFFKGISERLPANEAGLLVWAWVAWGVSLAAILCSFYTSQLAIKRAIKQVDRGENPSHFGGWCDRATSILNALGGALFLVGVGCAIVFVHHNLH